MNHWSDVIEQQFAEESARRENLLSRIRGDGRIVHVAKELHIAEEYAAHWNSTHRAIRDTLLIKAHNRLAAYDETTQLLENYHD